MAAVVLVELLSPSFLFFILLLLLSFLISTIKSTSSPTSPPYKLPKCYPLIASSLEIFKNRNRRNQWLSDLLLQSPTGTLVLHRPLGVSQAFTVNPANVHHILKTHFHLYPKGNYLRTSLTDFMGAGIFNSDGVNWKFQRQISSHEFNTKSLRKFVDTVVDAELSERLVPILSDAAATKSVLDFQDILQRFAFDNICKIAFGYDPQYLLPSLPETQFAVAFEDAVRISSERFNCVLPLFWKTKRMFNIGSEKRLRRAISTVREFAQNVVREKKKKIKGVEESKSSLQTSSTDDDLLSRILSSAHVDEKLAIEMVISFILAGRDTTSAALTWFFWLLSRNPRVEQEILKEVVELKQIKPDSLVYDEVKEMVYTHASLCESMRLYPPVPTDTKEAAADDVLPDGTAVKKGMRVAYHPYTMGRMESLWGPDWRDFRPERWLAPAAGKWSFVGRNPYEYPVFQAGPRICLGKEMAFLQMKRVVGGVLREFRVVPVMAEQGLDPVFIADLTSKMKGGFPVRIQRRLD